MRPACGSPGTCGWASSRCPSAHATTPDGGSSLGSASVLPVPAVSVELVPSPSWSPVGLGEAEDDPFPVAGDASGAPRHPGPKTAVTEMTTDERSSSSMHPPRIQKAAGSREGQAKRRKTHRAAIRKLKSDRPDTEEGPTLRLVNGFGPGCGHRPVEHSVRGAEAFARVGVEQMHLVHVQAELFALLGTFRSFDGGDERRSCQRTVDVHV